MSRYHRQIHLPQIGSEGQDRLQKAHVLIIGAGGLGSTLLPVLAGAGVGHLTIVDHDIIELSNLHRQTLFKANDIGKSKAHTACAALTAYNPEINIEARSEKLTPKNANNLLSGVDMVIDAADSFAATYTLSDACVSLRIPLISASVIGLGGYVGQFCGGGPSYRAVFPDMPQTAQNCAETGVLGSAVAVLGTLQAHIALRHLLGLSANPHQLISFDGQAMNFRSFDFTHAEEPLAHLPFIAAADVTSDDNIIDVRGLDEAPQSPFSNAHRVLPDEVDKLVQLLDSGSRTVICCRSGMRAARAAQKLQSHGIKNLALVAFG